LEIKPNHLETGERGAATIIIITSLMYAARNASGYKMHCIAA
jgi:hypothetical protein